MNREELDNILKRIYNIMYVSVMTDEEKVKTVRNILREYRGN